MGFAQLVHLSDSQISTNADSSMVTIPSFFKQQKSEYHLLQNSKLKQAPCPTSSIFLPSSDVINFNGANGNNQDTSYNAFALNTDANAFESNNNQNFDLEMYNENVIDRNLNEYVDNFESSVNFDLLNSTNNNIINNNNNLLDTAFVKIENKKSEVDNLSFSNSLERTWSANKMLVLLNNITPL